MVGIERGQDRLIVSDGPSDLRRATTFGALAAALVVAFLLVTRPLAGSVQLLGALSALVPLFVLARGWTTVQHVFDRGAGLLVVTESGLVRSLRRREMPIAHVASVVDRRSAADRALELVLHDRTSL